MKHQNLIDVIALEVGFDYISALREPGERFQMPEDMEGSWFEPVDTEAANRAKALRDAELKRVADSKIAEDKKLADDLAELAQLRAQAADRTAADQKATAAMALQKKEADKALADAQAEIETLRKQAADRETADKAAAAKADRDAAEAAAKAKK